MELVLYEEFVSVMEARDLTDVVDMRITRDKLKLPFDANDRRHGKIIYFMNTSLDGIAKIINNGHPKISNIGKMYNTYYYDYLSLFKAFKGPGMPNTGKTRSIARRERAIRLAEIAEKVEGINTPFTLEQSKYRNLVYDIDPIIDAMKQHPKMTKVNYLRKMDIFFTSVDKLMSTNMNTSKGMYDGKTIFIDLDEYKGQESLNSYHMLTYLSLLLKKRPKLIERYRGTYDILFYTSRGYLKFDMTNDMLKENYNRLHNYIVKLKPDVSTNAVIDKIDNEIISNQVNAAFTGTVDDIVPVEFDEGDDESVKDIPEDDTTIHSTPANIVTPDSKVVKTIKEKINAADIDASDENDETVASIINNADDDEQLKAELAKVIIDSNKGTKSRASTKRDQLLRERQKNIMIKSRTLGELVKDVEIPKVETLEIEDAPTINEPIKKVKYYNFQKTYNDTLAEKDIADVFTMFNGKTIDMNVVSVKSTDSSDTLNLKETYTVVFEDELRRRHTIKVNLPKYIDDQKLYINGGTKTIETQITAMPVIKTDNDTVRINTNYNKLTIVRKGTRFNPNVERFKKLVEAPNNSWTVVRGDNSEANKGELTCLEYDNLAVRYNTIISGKYHFVFNVDQLMDETDHKFESTLDKILIGYSKVGSKIEPIYYDRNNPDHVDMVTLILTTVDPDKYDEFKQMSAGKKYIYTTTTIMRKEIPTVALLCFFEGLTQVIHKFGDKNVEFVDKKSNKDNYIYIRFEDGYLRYPMSDMEACIMFNGLNAFTTTNYSIADLDNQQSYIDILTEITGDGYIAGALVNFYDFLIDPITLKLLVILSLPTDVVSLIIYANNLLADNQYRTDLHFSNYRLRNNEIVAAILYKQLSIAYARYRATARNSNPVKMSVDPDCVIKALQKLPTVQDYPYLGPMTEVKMNYLASMKGYAGMNNDEAYKQDKRVYDDSMMGIVGVSTDNAKNCGKERHLVVEPKIINARGMVELTDPKDFDKLEDVEIETALELLNPSGLLHDDPVRTAMATKQRGHVIPVKSQSPMLISNGMDATIQYRTSDDYSVVAKQSGKVLSIDNTTKLMTIQYKDGTKRCIDLYPKMAKNGGAGMYLKNQLVTSFNAGDSFKKDAILAFDPYFYKDNEFFGNRLTIGTLVKTAIMSSPATYEDSDQFTKKLSKDMSSEITMCKKVIIGKNSNVDYIVKIGSSVKVGDELIRFETSYNDSEMNKLLAGIRDDLHEAIVSLGKTRITSKYDGRIDDILCYPTVSLEEMSPSLAKVVKTCQSSDVSRSKHLNSIDPGKGNSPYKAGCLMNRPVGVVQPDQYGKIDGEDVTDAIMFKFFITYLDELSDGDKLVHQTANKATLGDMIPEGFEPYTEFRPYEEISLLQAPSAILQRGTQSIEPSMLMYKGLIEVKRKQYEILTGESWNEKARRENPYMDHSNQKVSESVEISDDLFAVIESVFDLGESDDGYLKANKYYSPGDIVIYGSSGYDINSLRAKLDISDDYNVSIDNINNCLMTTRLIYPGEKLLLGGNR